MRSTEPLPNPCPSRRRWLVVEDDPAALDLTAQARRAVADAEVVACDHPRRALDVFFTEPESFDLLVTDYNLPELDGLALARAIHGRAPNLPVVMVTGGDLDGAQSERGELKALLPKPCRTQELVSTVLGVLAGQAQANLPRPRPPAGWA